MTLSRLKRPVVLVLAFALAGLAVLRRRGDLRPRWATDEPAELGWRGRVAGPLREDFRGEKVLVAFGPYRFLARLPRDPAANARLRPGQTIRLAGKLRPGRPARNPGDFDEEAFLADRGISGVVEARSLAIEAAPIPWVRRPAAAAEGARRSLQDCLRRRLPFDQARVMEGLMLGYKGALPRDLNRAVQDSGVMHLLVPSGAKVALALGLAAALCALFPLPLGARYAACGAAGGFYVLMVGAEPPYLRAYFTALAYFGARLLGREADAAQALALSALAIAALDPRAPFSTGFQMTYAAMAGLLVALPRLRALSRGAALLAITILVQVMLWPVFANVFGKGSLVAPAANLVCVPLAPLLVGAGLWLWLCEGAGCAGFWAPVVGKGASWFIRLCRFFSAPAWASVALSPMPPYAVAGYYALAFSLLAAGSRKARLALAAAGLAVWAGGAAAREIARPPLRVLFLKLPRGKVAALASFAGEAPWLVGEAPPSLLKRVLRAEGAARVARVLPARTFRACSGTVCVTFDPPAVQRGADEFDILAPRLKRSAVEVTTDGNQVEIKSIGRAADQFGRLVL